LGVLNSTASFQDVDYRKLLRRWTESMPAEWGFTEENRRGSIRGAALPMGFNRKPHYRRGLLLVGDSGGMVNPFNGEGIAYAMEAAEYAADAVAEAHQRGIGTASAERALRGYPARMDEALGGYYRLGTIFVKLIGHPEVMRICTRYGLPRKTLMKFTLKLLANLTDGRDGDAMDRLINSLSRMAPAV